MSRAPLAVPALLALLFPLLCATAADNPATLNREEAKKAFEYLNQVRADPPAFAKELGVPELKDVKPAKTLKWNDALAKAAEAKAIDMATRGYTEHVDPDGFGMNIKMQEAGYALSKLYLKSKDQNNFESIAGGYESGVRIISTLVLDKNVPSLGHRKHLLGIGDFRSKHVDIGVGIAFNPKSEYKYYTCILIAHH